MSSTASRWEISFTKASSGGKSVEGLGAWGVKVGVAPWRVGVGAGLIQADRMAAARMAKRGFFGSP